jgi:hypothetical protein
MAAEVRSFRPWVAGAVLTMAALFASIAAAVPAATAGCSAKSGAQTAVLLELYTSEGCESCPPADRWLSSSFPPRAGNAAVIPLAFHVDYWDRLGWKDRFATRAWTDRQYAAAHAAGSTLVYTPQVLLQGKDFSGWRNAPTSKTTVDAANARPARAEIALETLPREGAVAVKATVRVPDAANRKGAALFVAFVDSGLVSEIKAGENAGKQLRHDHVVRTLRGGIPLNSGSVAEDIVLPLPVEAGTAATVVAFVQNIDTGDVLQALASPVACAPSR